MTDNITEFQPELVEGLLEHVFNERQKQHESWGRQSWPSFASEETVRRYGRKAESWKQINDAREKVGELTWEGILLEEVYEALSETEPRLRIMELVQVAAVALAEAEALALFLGAIESEDEDEDVLSDPELVVEFDDTEDYAEVAL